MGGPEVLLWMTPRAFASPTPCPNRHTAGSSGQATARPAPSNPGAGRRASLERLRPEAVHASGRLAVYRHTMLLGRGDHRVLAQRQRVSRAATDRLRRATAAAFVLRVRESAAPPRVREQLRAAPWHVTGPAVKTSTPDLPPCGAGCAVGGNRVWAEYLGRRASALATLLRTRALLPSVGSGFESDGSARSLRP
jgi:hypothetical protein